MAANDSFFQRKKPAAVLKHAVLAEYFNVFCAMVGGSFSGPVWLVDGYAGPGTYDADDDGDPVTGSPIVALEIAEKAAQWKSPRNIRCAFIEQKPNYLKQLRLNVKPFQDRGCHAQGEERGAPRRTTSAKGWRRLSARLSGCPRRESLAVRPSVTRCRGPHA